MIFLARKTVIGIQLFWDRTCQWKWVCALMYYIWTGVTLCRNCNKLRGILLLNVETNEFASCFAPLRWDLKAIYEHRQFYHGATHLVFLKYDCGTHQGRLYPSKGLKVCFWTCYFCNFRCEGHPCRPCSQSHWESARHSYLFESNSVS